jgi:hypothetical protein
MDCLAASTSASISARMGNYLKNETGARDDAPAIAV